MYSDAQTKAYLANGSAGGGGFDWTSPRFVAVDMHEMGEYIRLEAGGEAVTLKGSLFRIESDAVADMNWSAARGQFMTLSLSLKSASPALLRKVCWFPGTWEDADETVINSTNLQDNVLFVRKGDISFFLSLDFPSSTINDSGICYEPFDLLAPERTYDCHTLSIGACQLSGIKVGAYDRAEIEAVSAYIEQRYPLRYERPVVSSVCITNRMTDVREGRVFYSMFDNPTLALNPEVLEDEVRLCSELGIEYYQLFEGMFDWPDQETNSASLRKIVDLGEKLNVRVGDYLHPGELYCPHYNYEHRRLDKPEWRQLSKDGKRGQLCLGCKEYSQFLIDRVVAHNREHNEEFICMDMLDIQPCYDTSHGHPAGDVYRQVRGLVELMEGLAGLSPDYLVWTNSGNWIEFMPKLGWYNPNMYLTDPHPRAYSQNLNALKYMGDCRREQMVTVHHSHFVPYRFFTNCEYYYTRRSRIHDMRVFEYSLLQGLAVTPNLCLAELRTFLERIPTGKRAQAEQFIKKWNQFMRNHFHYWKQTLQVGDSPGVGAGEIYAHIVKDSGFLCLVNQNPYIRTVKFRLDGSIGLSEDLQYELFEIYPNECPLAEQPLPYAAFGQEIQCVIPPHAVRYIEVKPRVRTATSDQVMIYGLPSVVEATDNGYRAYVSALQGERVRIGVALPEGQQLNKIAASQVQGVPMYTFPASAEMKAQSDNLAYVDIQFPRERAPRVLNQWRLVPDDVMLQLPLSNGYPFLGGLISGAYAERYDVQLDLITIPCPESTMPGLTLQAEWPAPQEEPELTGARHKLETEFVLPFMEWSAFAPGYDDDVVLELVFTNPEYIKAIAASINGNVVEVRRYPLATKPEWYTYYIELTGNVGLGKARIVLDIEWDR